MSGESFLLQTELLLKTGPTIDKEGEIETSAVFKDQANEIS